MLEMQRKNGTRGTEAADEGKSEQESKRKEKSLAASRPGERRRSVSIFLRRRKKKCFTDQRALEKSKETRGEKEGGDLKRLFFFLPRTLSRSPSSSLAHTQSHTSTHHTHSHTHVSTPLSLPRLMATKGAAKKKKSQTQQQLILNRLNQ